jgi:rhodanese-related sulfurtransferase
MPAEQILLYALVALILFYIVRKYLQIKSIQHYSANEVADKIKKDRNLVLLDVRTEKERNRNKIKGSFHVPLYEINSSNNELKRFSGKEIICYCETGSRSLSAAIKLKKFGFNAANLKGGMLRWNSR